MSNLESPGANNSRGFGGIENGESSDAAAQFSTPNARLELLEESRDELSSFNSTRWEDFFSEDDIAAPIDFASSRPSESTRNDLKRKGAISNHKGVHFKQKNKKFVSRLYLPGGKSRKLELGEYNTHDRAARAYHVGTFYYNKSSTSDCCGEDNSFLESLPCVPDNLSDADKSAWVREQARHSAASIGSSETPRICSSKRVLQSGCSSFDARPSTPASYGAQGSCDDYHSTPTTPTTSGSADRFLLGDAINNRLEGSVDSLRWLLGDAINNHNLLEGKSAAPQSPSESKRRRCFQTRSQGSPNVELQQGRNSNTLTNQTPVVDRQVVSQVKMTDSILFALFELRKQGWEWTLKLRSPSSVEAGVLFLVPESQNVAPALRITDIITTSFHELREQGWEVHLQPHGGAEVELRSELCVAPTECVAQDKMKASKFSALGLKIGAWRRASRTSGVQVEVKFSYAKQKLVWEVLESGQRRKMEIHWSDIDAMKATYSNFHSNILLIHVSRPPPFFKCPIMWSSWVACTDFTGGQASVCMLHSLHFPQGVLKEHYEKLVQSDPRIKAAHIRGQECVVLKEHYKKLVQCNPRLTAAHIQGQEWVTVEAPAILTQETDSCFEDID